MKPKRVVIIGTQGLYSNYGGFDVLVGYLAERKSESIDYLIFNDSNSPVPGVLPPGISVKQLRLSAAGYQGILYDFWSILVCYFSVDTILLLGVQGIPLIGLLRMFKKVRVVSNVGGVEWLRPKFGFMLKCYFKWCFNLSMLYSDIVILDNEYYRDFLPKKIRAEVKVIPYGGEIDQSLMIEQRMKDRYPFITQPYFLSVSRSLEDNLLEPLCKSFTGSKHTLVLISNLSSSKYGKRILAKYSHYPNIILIDGLYIKPELDLIRRHCKAYIHTHTLCGTAPSLVEMVMANRPILSINMPQNVNTLRSEGFFFSTFDQLHKLLDDQDNLDQYIPKAEIRMLYDWNTIIRAYESVY